MSLEIPIQMEEDRLPLNSCRGRATAPTARMGQKQSYGPSGRLLLNIEPAMPCGCHSRLALPKRLLSVIGGRSRAAGISAR
jgi:hypothetical protein